MSKQLVLDLNDATYDALVRLAARAGDQPEQRAAVLLELFTRTAQPGRNGVPPPSPLNGAVSVPKSTNGHTGPPENPPATPAPGYSRRFFGSISVGHPRGLDNEKIDEDLAEEYGRGLSQRAE